jgi:hypothetical protein
MNLNYQAKFQQRWPQLIHPHVRSLAWLLDSPSLLNADSEQWINQLAELPPTNLMVAEWLAELDKKPEPLIEYLALHPQTRLGHYAENLLAFYFLWRGELLAHRVQVRSAMKNTTIGEFDFLLTMPGGLEHWEFACKFYLLVTPETKLSDYVGPNLMDNLFEKSRKIMNGQLALSQHPEAIKYLTEPVIAAKALVKGWLFYSSVETKPLIEVAPNHCRGLWCRLSDLKKMNANCFNKLSRLQWLAPAKVRKAETMNFDQLYGYLEQLFLTDARPVLVAQLVPDAKFYVECERIFVVPDAWNQVTLLG